MPLRCPTYGPDDARGRGPDRNSRDHGPPLQGAQKVSSALVVPPWIADSVPVLDSLTTVGAPAGVASSHLFGQELTGGPSTELDESVAGVVYPVRLKPV